MYARILEATRRNPLEKIIEEIQCAFRVVGKKKITKSKTSSERSHKR